MLCLRGGFVGERRKQEECIREVGAGGKNIEEGRREKEGGKEGDHVRTSRKRVVQYSWHTGLRAFRFHGVLSSPGLL